MPDAESIRSACNIVMVHIGVPTLRSTGLFQNFSFLIKGGHELTKSIAPLVGLAILLLSTCYTTMAQVDDRDLEKRIFNLGLLRTGKSAKTKREPKAVLAEVQDDFTKLQAANNELAEANEKNTPLDLEFAEASLKEMRTRAERLMENLTESKLKKREVSTSPADKNELKIWISKLDTVVGEFSHNPVFREASPDDDKLAKKALKDLDQIIQLTYQLLKGTEMLKK